MKLLYLDFDGVLHDEEVWMHPKDGIQLHTNGRTLFEWSPILVQLLAPYPDVKIVLSTSWVRIRSFNFAKYKLCRGLRERVIGATFHHHQMDSVSFSYLPRGAQVAADVRRRQPDAWFAIDDDGWNWPDWCKDNLIKTDGEKGISDPRIQAAIQQLLERF